MEKAHKIWSEGLKASDNMGAWVCVCGNNIKVVL